MAGEENTIRGEILLGVKNAQQTLNEIRTFKDQANTILSDVQGGMARTMGATVNRQATQLGGMPQATAQYFNQSLATFAGLRRTFESAEFENLSGSLQKFNDPSYMGTLNYRQKSQFRRQIQDELKSYYKVVDEVSKEQDVEYENISKLKKDQPLLYKSITTSLMGSPENFEANRAMFRRYTKSFVDKVKDDVDSTIGGTFGGGASGVGGRAYLASMAYAAFGLGTNIAQYVAAGQTAFNLGSPEGMYAARAQYGIAGTRLAGSSIGGVAGVLAGIAAAGLAPETGGLSLLLASYLGYTGGSALGGAIAEFPARGAEAQLMVRENLVGRTREANAAYDRYNIASTRMGRRFGSVIDPNAMTRFGMGGDQANQLGYQYGAGFQYDQRGFEEAVGFATQFGIPVEQAIRMNQLGMFTGRAFANFGSIESVARRTGAGTARMPQMMESILGIANMVGTQYGVGGGFENQVFGLSQLPAAIAGKDNYYGDVTRGGMQTLSGLQGLFSPSNQAMQLLMFQALGLGKVSIYEVMARAREGLLGKGNLRAVSGRLREVMQSMGITTGREAGTFLSTQSDQLAGLNMQALTTLGAGVLDPHRMAEAERLISGIQPGGVGDYAATGAAGAPGALVTQAEMTNSQITAMGERHAEIWKSNVDNVRMFMDTIKKNMDMVLQVLTSGTEETANKLKELIDQSNRSVFVPGFGIVRPHVEPSASGTLPAHSLAQPRTKR